MPPPRPLQWRLQFRTSDEDDWTLYPAEFETPAQAAEAGDVKFLGTTTTWRVVAVDGDGGDKIVAIREPYQPPDADAWGTGPRRRRAGGTQPAHPPE